jgi:ribosomal protein L29
MADIIKKIKDIRVLSDDDIKTKMAELRRHIFDLKSQAVTENLKNPCVLPAARKCIAQMMTVLGERSRKKVAEASVTAGAAK